MTASLNTPYRDNMVAGAKMYPEDEGYFYCWDPDTLTLPEGRKVRFRESDTSTVYGIDVGGEIVVEVFAVSHRWGPSDGHLGREHHVIQGLEHVSDAAWKEAVDGV